MEPLTSFYKDEVREIGREIGIPAKFLSRHPFPGPGLAIRCLCSEKEAGLTETDGGFLLPLRSVGVQGDARSYRAVFALPQRPTLAAYRDNRARADERQIRYQSRGCAVRRPKRRWLFATSSRLRLPSSGLIFCGKRTRSCAGFVKQADLKTESGSFRWFCCRLAQAQSKRRINRASTDPFG